MENEYTKMISRIKNYLYGNSDWQKNREPFRIKCSQCGSVIPEESTEIIWTIDSDAYCNETCKKKHDEEMDHFCTNILPNDRAYASWLGVPESWVKSK